MPEDQYEILPHSEIDSQVFRIPECKGKGFDVEALQYEMRFNLSKGVGKYLDLDYIESSAPERYPSYWHALGFLKSEGTFTDTSLVYCLPYIEQVDVETTFQLPDFVIDPTDPPRIADESAKVLVTGYYDRPSGSYSAVSILHAISSVLRVGQVDLCDALSDRRFVEVHVKKLCEC